MKVFYMGCLITLAACNTISSVNTPSDHETKHAVIKSPVKNKKIVQTPTAGASALKLLEVARKQAEDGQGDLAAATLERAIKIEPGNPWLWHRLAVLRMQQEKWAQAIELANRSIALANGNQRLLGGNWLVISLALEGAGSREAAATAKKNSEKYLKE